VSEIVAVAVDSCAINAGIQSPEERLDALGKHLISLGSVGSGDFKDWLRTVALVRLSTLARSYEAVLINDGYYPADWAAELRERIERIASVAQNKECPVPLELRTSTDSEMAFITMQQLLRHFGELLVWWPAITERAERLAASGRHLAIGAAL
jgi:hypothetical protein